MSRSVTIRIFLALCVYCTDCNIVFPENTLDTCFYWGRSLDNTFESRFGQKENQGKVDTLIGKDEWILSSMLRDQVRLWSPPLRISKKDMAVVIPVIASTAACIIFDEEIYSAFKNYQANHQWVSDVSPVITYGGDNKFVLGTGGIFAITGLISGNSKTSQTGLILLQTWAHAGFIVQVGKLLTGRQRPSFDDGKDWWYGFPASLKRFGSDPVSKYDAFPSGHTIEAWAMATVIAMQYSDCKPVPVISYIFATGVGLSRVTEDAHWLSDVILGAAMGYGIGRYMVREHKDTHWVLLPVHSKGLEGLTAIYRF